MRLDKLLIDKPIICPIIKKKKEEKIERECMAIGVIMSEIFLFSFFFLFLSFSTHNKRVKNYFLRLAEGGRSDQFNKL